jgi:hypothetical protein
MADMKYVQERLGLGSMQITADVYAHISKKIETATMDKFEGYTKNILNYIVGISWVQKTPHSP